MKSVKVAYNADTLETTITVDGKAFDTSRIDGKEIEIWAYPFMMRKIKWNGFYDEMIEALGEKEFNLIFEGSESDLNELKEAWEDAPVHIVEENSDMPDVVIEYDEENLTTKITVNGEEFDTSRINGKEIEDWIFPFMIRKVKWDGIFEELAKVIGSEKYKIQFSGIDSAMQILMEECPETVSIILKKVDNFDVCNTVCLSQEIFSEFYAGGYSGKMTEYIVSEIKDTVENLKKGNKTIFPVSIKAITDVSGVSGSDSPLTASSIEELISCISEIYESWDSPRANLYRGNNNINWNSGFSIEITAQCSENVTIKQNLETKPDKNEDDEEEVFICYRYEENNTEFKSAGYNSDSDKDAELYEEAVNYSDDDDFDFDDEFTYDETLENEFRSKYELLDLDENASEEYNISIMESMNALINEYIGKGSIEAELELVEMYKMFYELEEELRNPDSLNIIGQNVTRKCDGNQTQKIWTVIEELPPDRIKIQQDDTTICVNVSEVNFQSEVNLNESRLMQSIYEWGRKNLGVSDYAKAAFELCSELTEKNIASAYSKLGDIYSEGIGFEKDDKKAFELYQMGAALNDYYSIRCLALAYEYGDGCEVNIERALNLYEKAAELKPDNEYTTNKLQSLHTKVDLSEVYYVSNIANYKPFKYSEKREKKNFLYGALFHIDSDTLTNIINILNTCDKNKSTDKSEDFFKSVDIWWDAFDFNNAFSLDYDDNNENERAKKAKKLVTKLFKYDSDIIVSSMKWLRTRLDVLEKSSDNSSLRNYLQNIKDKYNSLTDDLSNDFGQNNTSLFSFFADYGDRSELNPFWSAIIDSYNSEIDKYNRKIEELNKKNNKSSTRNAIGGVVAGGLLSLIPVVGFPLGMAASAGITISGIGEASEQEYESALDNEITNIHKIIYYGTVIAILDNVSDCIIDDIEEKVSFANHQSSNSFSDDSDDFFDEI